MSRDTQFAGFARKQTREIIGLLIERGLLDLDENDHHVLDECASLATRRAYDFALHVIDTVDVDPCGASADQLIPGIPDLATLPEEEK